MATVKAALGQPLSPPVIQPQWFAPSGLRLLALMQYDVEYVVADIESLVFWLDALDPRHADVDGQAALASAAMLNRVLAGNVDERGFVTNEHRYLAVAQCEGERARAFLRWPGDPVRLFWPALTGWIRGRPHGCSVGWPPRRRNPRAMISLNR
jgi:hypothetical protein